MQAIVPIMMHLVQSKKENFPLITKFKVSIHHKINKKLYKGQYCHHIVAKKVINI